MVIHSLLIFYNLKGNVALFYIILGHNGSLGRLWKRGKMSKTLSWWESQFKIACYVSNFIILNVTRLYFYQPDRCDGEHDGENELYNSCLANAWSSTSIYIMCKAEIHHGRSLYDRIAFIIEIVFYN